MFYVQAGCPNLGHTTLVYLHTAGVSGGVAAVGSVKDSTVVASPSVGHLQTILFHTVPIIFIIKNLRTL